MDLTLRRSEIMILGLVIGVASGMLLFFLPFITAIKAIAGLIAMMCILIRPVIGLYLIVFSIPIISIRNVLVLCIITLFSVFIKLICKEDFKLKKVPLKYSMILFIVPFIFAAFTSFTISASIEKLIVYIVSFILLFLSINLIDSKQKLYYLILALIISSVIVSLYGLYQYKIGISVQESWVDRELNPDLKTRVYSTLENPNILAEYLIMTIPLTIALLWNSKNKLNKLWFLIIGFVQLLCILLTFSRGGWIGIAFSMVIFAIFIDRRLILFYLAGALVLVAVSPEIIMTRIATIGNVEDSSTAFRFPLWMASFDIIKDYWLTGVGLGPIAFKAIYPNYMRMGITAVHAHNIYLQLFIETGILGFIGFLLFVFSNIRCNLISFAKGIDTKIKRISIAVMSSILGLLVHGLVEYIFFNNKIIMIFWIIMSIGLVSFMLEFSNTDHEVVK